MIFLKRIVLTGGGTAGHITPNLALVPGLLKEGYEIFYIGAAGGMEEELVKAAGVKFYGISAGKLRRELSAKNLGKNFTDLFRVVKGIWDAGGLMKKLMPDIVFSKGGFVSVPVVLAARMNGVRVIAHESDITPGLANKISLPFSDKICVTFPETLKYLPEGKGVLTGSPIREALFSGDRLKGLRLCGFSGRRPVIMIMGGSLGAVSVNNCVRSIIGRLLMDFDIVHICGKGNLDTGLLKLGGYKQFEYVSDELPHIFAAADLIISRAGANSISEFLALRKPNLLIPLSAASSRGDQIQNAKSFERQGFSVVLPEPAMTGETLEKNVRRLFAERGKYIGRMERAASAGGADKIIEIIKSYDK